MTHTQITTDYHFHNPTPGRYYRIEIIPQDLIGDCCIVCYYGSHRKTTVHPTIETAIRTVAALIKKRRQRGYQIIEVTTV